MTIWNTLGEFFYGLSQDFLSIPRLLAFSALIIGYFFGLFQSAFILSKARHVDIYSKGSGNPGTTNMFRVMGAGFGLLTFLLDIAKVVAAIFLTKYIFLTWLQLPIDPIALKLYTGLGVVLGHNFPIYLHFKGGKGVAATCAVYACLGEWKYIIVGLFVFLLIFLITRYVSLASMTVLIVLMFEFLLLTLMNWTYVESGWLIDCQVIVITFAALVLITHRQNILRLLYGEESRFSFRRKKEPELSEDSGSEYYNEEDYEEETEEVFEDTTATEAEFKEPAEIEDIPAAAVEAISFRALAEQTDERTETLADEKLSTEPVEDVVVEDAAANAVSDIVVEAEPTEDESVEAEKAITAEETASADEATVAETPVKEEPKEYRTNHNKATPQKKKKKHSTTKKKKSNGTKKKKK